MALSHPETTFTPNPFHQIPLSSHIYQHSLSSPYTTQINLCFGPLRNNFLTSHFQLSSIRHRQSWDKWAGPNNPSAFKQTPLTFVCITPRPLLDNWPYSHILRLFASGEYIFVYTWENISRWKTSNAMYVIHSVAWFFYSVSGIIMTVCWRWGSGRSGGLPRTH